MDDWDSADGTRLPPSGTLATGSYSKGDNLSLGLCPKLHEKREKLNGVLLRNCQIHDTVGQISPSYAYVFGCHGLSFVAVIVETWRQLGNVAVCRPL